MRYNDIILNEGLKELNQYNSIAEHYIMEASKLEQEIKNCVNDPFHIVIQRKLRLETLLNDITKTIKASKNKLVESAFQDLVVRVKALIKTNNLYKLNNFDRK